MLAGEHVGIYTHEMLKLREFLYKASRNFKNFINRYIFPLSGYQFSTYFRYIKRIKDEAMPSLPILLFYFKITFICGLIQHKIELCRCVILYLVSIKALRVFLHLAISSFVGVSNYRYILV